MGLLPVAQGAGVAWGRHRLPKRPNREGTSGGSPQWKRVTYRSPDSEITYALAGISQVGFHPGGSGDSPHETYEDE